MLIMELLWGLASMTGKPYIDGEFGLPLKGFYSYRLSTLLEILDFKMKVKMIFPKELQKI